MASSEKITAETRSEFGKGAARRIRRADKIPAVIYGHGIDPLHVTLPGHATMMALKHGGANALLELEVDGKEQLALTKAVQVDPIRRVIEHIDFVTVRRGEKVTVDVPVQVTGEAGPETLVVTENATVQLEADAMKIPEYIEVSVEGAEVGTQFLAETLVVNVAQQISAEALEAELEEAEAEAGIERDESEDEAAEAAAEGEGDAEGGESAEGDSSEE
jgi:large subunit ribosomal protein L25